MKSLLAEDKGSITLEAAIAFPVFLGLLLILINFINVAVHYVAMDHAVDESVKLIAAGSYPLRYLKTGVVKSDSMTAGIVESLVGNRVTAETGPVKPVAAAFGSDLFSNIAGEWLKRGLGSALEAVIKQVAAKKIREIYPWGKLSPGDFEITDIRVYDPNNTGKGNGKLNGITLNNEDVALVVRHRVKIAAPFFPLKEIILSNCAVERAWADD